MSKLENLKLPDISQLPPELALLFTTILFLLISTVQPALADKLRSPTGSPVIPVMDCNFPKHYDLGTTAIGNAFLQFYTLEAWVQSPQIFVYVGSGFSRTVKAEISYGIGAVNEIKTITFTSNTNVIIPRSTTGYPILEIIFNTTPNSELHVDLELVAGSECKDVGTIEPTFTPTATVTPTNTPEPLPTVTATFVPTAATEVPTPDGTVVTVVPTATVDVSPIPTSVTPTVTATATVTVTPTVDGQTFQVLLPIVSQ